MVLGAANIVWTSGNRVFASNYFLFFQIWRLKCWPDKHTIVGDFGFYHTHLGLKDFAQDWKVENKYVASGKYKLRLNSFEDLKEQDVKWYQFHLFNLAKSFFSLSKC